MTTPATATDVHVEIPHFHAIYEGDVAWDACGPVANEVAVACLEGRTPDIGNATRARERDLAAGKFTVGSGQTLADILWDLTTQRGYTNVEHLDYSDTPDLNAIHDMLKRGGVEGLPVILILTNAQAIFDNQTGVHGHFVVSGGIDSVKGYLIANGDTKTGIAEHPGFPGIIPTNWVGWGDIVSAQPHGALLVHHKPGQPVTPLGWTDDGATLRAPNDGACGHGMRWAVLTWASGWDASLEPVTGEIGEPGGVYQDFRHGGDANAAGVRLTWHAGDGSITSGPLAAPTPAPAPAPAPAPQPTHYTVTAAEAGAFPLAAIAQAVYGDATLWPIIYEANKALIGGNPNAVYAGEQLTIPPKPANGGGPGYIVVSGPMRAESR